VGYALLIAATVFFPSPIMLLILLLGGMETYRRWKQRKSPEARAYYKVATRTRFIIAAVYLGLALALAVGMDMTHVQRDFGDV
jgi:hypothetical protein